MSIQFMVGPIILVSVLLGTMPIGCPISIQIVPNE